MHALLRAWCGLQAIVESEAVVDMDETRPVLSIVAVRDDFVVFRGQFFFLRLPNGQYGPVSQLSRSEKCCTGPFNWGEAHCAGEKVKRKVGLFQRKSL